MPQNTGPEDMPQNEDVGDTPENAAEEQPKTYEELLLEAKQLKKRGIGEAYDLEEPELKKFWHDARAWKATLDLPQDGVVTPEQAVQTLRMVRLLVDAGHSDEETITEAQDTIFEELTLSKLRPGSEEACAVLEEAASELDKLLAMKKPEREITVAIDALVAAARAKAEQGDFAGAVQFMQGKVLGETKYRKFLEKSANKEKFDAIVEERAGYSARFQEEFAARMKRQREEKEKEQQG